MNKSPIGATLYLKILTLSNCRPDGAFLGRIIIISTIVSPRWSFLRKSYNIQQELLRLYSHQVATSDLIEIKDLIGKYFAKRLSQMADVAWENNNWTNEDMEAMLNPR